MAKTTLWFGVALAVLGIGFFVATGSAHKTALIPTWFGSVLVICGLLANTESVARRMAFMHVAVLVALIGFVVPTIRLVQGAAKGKDMTGSAALEQGMMAGLCLVLTIACIRSFIAARRARA